MAENRSRPADLFPNSGAPPGVIAVNERCLVRTQDGHRIVIVSGVPLAQYAVGDAMAEANAMVSLATLKPDRTNEHPVQRVGGRAAGGGWGTTRE